MTRLVFNKDIRIGSIRIAEKSRAMIIAEAGVNHGGDLDQAFALIDAAADAGADAVKFQTFKTEELIKKGVEKAPYQVETTGSGESQYDMLKRLELSIEQTRRISVRCKERGIVFLTTPFDDASLSDLDALDLPGYKIASTDVTNVPYLIKVARKGKPILLSTGMAYLTEIDLALAEIAELNRDVVLLQCTANYPIRDEEANLAVLETFRERYDMLLGYSDHTTGLGAAAFAIPLGAKVLEKHFTLDKNAPGPDHRASLDPEELRDFVQLVRRVESFMGDGRKFPNLSELGTRKSLQKCLVASGRIRTGEVFSEDNCKAVRTGGIGISPLYFRSVFGRVAKRSFDDGDIIEP